MSEPFEKIPPGEETARDKLLATLLAKIVRENPPPGKMQRDAHPKQHGLVKAEFIVEGNLPEELRIGVFKEVKSYPAWIRFSNQNAPAKADNNKDIRGMAIKLMGVEGEKLLAEEKYEKTQDFLVISTPMFVTRDVEEFEKLIASLVGKWWQPLFFFLFHPRVALNLVKANKSYANPLGIRYWSTTPYSLGNQAVKYSTKPTQDNFGEIPSNPSEGYLREAMVSSLRDQSSSFDFMVQLRTDPQSMPIEDPGKRWSEELSPFIKVATIKIPAQEFNSTAQFDYGNTLSFTPWHSLPEHAPLGGINRARKLIYETISKFRHEQNGIPIQEPVDFSMKPADTS